MDSSFWICKCLCILYRINRRNWWRTGQIQKNVGCKRYTVALWCQCKAWEPFYSTWSYSNELAIDAQEQGADGIIITGFSTGIAPTKEKVIEAKNGIHLPIILGSGINKSNAAELLQASDGAIVGSSFKAEGKIDNIVDFQRTRDFMKEVEKIRQEG